jgi:hypothetical protein
MSWLITAIAALLSGALGLVLVGLLANACVTWYHVSGFEGASGYFVVLLALLGGVLGIVIAMIVSRFTDPIGWMGFLRTVGVCLGTVALLTGIATAIAWWRADIPPKEAGNTLSLEVEFRFPSGDLPEPDAAWGIVLGSVESHRQRAKQQGTLRADAARTEGGRWILPTRVFLFTQRGERVVHLLKGDEYVASFGLPPESRANRASDAWSGWLPFAQQDGSPWPEDRMSYRYRIQRNVPPPPEPDPAEVEAAAFAALEQDAPLDAWLAHLNYDSPRERVDAVMGVVEPRQAELAALIASDDPARRSVGVRVVQRLADIEPEVRDAVIAEGKALAEALRAFNSMSAEDPRFMDVQIELRSRFIDWRSAWWSTLHKLGLDGRPLLRTIRDLAAKRAADTTMDEIVINTQVVLDALPSPSEK